MRAGKRTNEHHLTAGQHTQPSAGRGLVERTELGQVDPERQQVKPKTLGQRRPLRKIEHPRRGNDDVRFNLPIYSAFAGDLLRRPISAHSEGEVERWTLTATN